MAKSGKRRPMVSRPAATALPTIPTSSSSTTVASSSPYFLPDLIPLVASRLTTLEDFFALRAACRAYRSRLPLSSSNLASQGPLLLVHHEASASASDALFHVPSRRILQFRLPRTDGNPILTTFRSFRRRLFCAEDMENLTCFHSLGCLAIQNIKISGSRTELRVQHLLTGERSRLPYPPDVFRFQFPGLVFSGDLFIAFTPCCRDLYYCRIGDAHWRAARCDGGYDVYCLLFFKGILYALVYPNFRLATVELENDSVALSFLGDSLIAQKVPKASSFRLAECGGELLLIVGTGRYRVFRWRSGEMKWAETGSLRGCSLFFNRYEFAGCLGPDHPAVRRDCLYFTADFGNWIEYSLVDRSLHEIPAEYPGQAASNKEDVPLAWVLPSLC